MFLLTFIGSQVSACADEAPQPVLDLKAGLEAGQSAQSEGRDMDLEQIMSGRPRAGGETMIAGQGLQGGEPMSSGASMLGGEAMGGADTPGSAVQAGEPAPSGETVVGGERAVGGEPEVAGERVVGGEPGVAGGPAIGGESGVAGERVVGGEPEVAGEPRVAGEPMSAGVASSPVWPRCTLGPLPPVDVLFTPGVINAAQVLQERVAQLIRCTPSGEQVRISIYIWEHPLIAEAVEEAVDEGVDVRVVIDGSKPNNAPMIERLRGSIGAERVTVCPGACVGSGINHNKFVLISRLAQGDEEVVVQSTGNWRLHYRYNTMAVIHGDSSIYQAYRSYWDDLNAQRHDPNYYDSHVTSGDADFIAPLKLYIFPRATGGDTIVSILNNVTACPTGSTIRVAMGDFTNPRQGVAARLEALRQMGCNVHVFTVEDLGAQVLSTLGGEGSPRLHLHALSDPTRVHSKYLAIDAEYYNQGRRKLVWFGSHNLTGPALRSNDETLLRIENDLVWQAFMSNWHQMHQRPHSNHPTPHP